MKDLLNFQTICFNLIFSAAKPNPLKNLEDIGKKQESQAKTPKLKKQSIKQTLKY